MTLKSEDAFLALIDEYFGNGNEFLKLGRGDDCAILNGGADYCVSSDIFLEDVHFRRSYFSPKDIGYKALAVNISDIAAMGAKPVAFTMDLMAPTNLDEAFWREFFTGMASLARQNDLVLAGGDLSRSDKLGLSISIFGNGGRDGRFIRRQNCKPGDAIFVCGPLGLARTGLLALEQDPAEAQAQYAMSVRAHLQPKPKVMIGTLLASAGVGSMMDVSDGLARDLPRLLGPDFGAELTLGPRLIEKEVTQYCAENSLDPVEFTFLGGEDYALIGTATEEDFATKVKSIPGCERIGTVTENRGFVLNGTPVSNPGFDHFG